MNTTLIYKEHGNNIIRKDFNVRKENEQNMVVFIKDMISKGIIEKRLFLNKLDKALFETKEEIIKASFDTSKEVIKAISETKEELIKASIEVKEEEKQKAINFIKKI